MVDVEASVTCGNGADGSGCIGGVDCDELALHSSKAFRSSGIQVMGVRSFRLGARVDVVQWGLACRRVGQKLEIRSPRCPGNGGADWQSWEVGSPGGGYSSFQRLETPADTL
jgi:hypothetical protein